MRLTSMMLATCLLAAGAASAQTLAPAPTFVGTVVSATRTTLLIKTGAEDYKLFVLDSDTTRPPQIQPGSSVVVASRASYDPDAPVATLVKVTAPPPPPDPQAAAQAPEVVPPSVRKLEQSVQRQTQRLRLGLRTGATIDQELFSLGAHVQIGPFFDEKIWARPNVELGFGEVTTLVALNFEGIYRIPVTQRDGRWAVFLGGGPGVNFTDQNFAPPGFDDGDDVDNDGDEDRFDDFNLDVGLNFLMGVQSRSGLFLELKAVAYSGPHIRFLVGYNF